MRNRVTRMIGVGSSVNFVSVAAITLASGRASRLCGLAGARWAEARCLESQLPRLVEDAPALGLAPPRSTSRASWRVIEVVALLTGREQVFVAHVLNRVGAMRAGKPHASIEGARVRMTVARFAAAIVIESAFADTFAPPAGANEPNVGAYVLPIARVSVFILRPDGHG